MRRVRKIKFMLTLSSSVQAGPVSPLSCSRDVPELWRFDRSSEARLKPLRSVHSISSIVKLTLVASAILLSSGVVAAQKTVPRPRPTSRFAHLTPNQTAVGGDWDFFISGTNLHFRSGSAKATEKFQTIVLPSIARKLSADSQNVYVWLDDQHVLA
jgi:hypothetical protein